MSGMSTQLASKLTGTENDSLLFCDVLEATTKKWMRVVCFRSWPVSHRFLPIRRMGNLQIPCGNGEIGPKYCASPCQGWPRCNSTSQRGQTNAVFGQLGKAKLLCYENKVKEKEKKKKKKKRKKKTNRPNNVKEPKTEPIERKQNLPTTWIHT